jgi:hypothetical protein
MNTIDDKQHFAPFLGIIPQAGAGGHKSVSQLNLFQSGIAHGGSNVRASDRRIVERIP